MGAVVAVAFLALGVELGDRDRSTVITDEPPTSLPRVTTPGLHATTTSTPDVGGASTTTTFGGADSSSAGPEGGSTGVRRQRILEDPAGDANGSPSTESDSSLDLLALDVDYDGESVTFVHVVAGEPTTDPPAGATGRHHDTYFRIPGHNLVHVSVETMKRDLVVLVGVIEPGENFGTNPAQRCTTCDVAFDARAHEVRVRIPVTFLNEVMARSDGGEIRPGVEVGGWEAYTSKTTTTQTYYEERESPHSFSAAPMDSAKRYDVFWKVP